MQPQYSQYPPYQPPQGQKKKPKWPWVLLGLGALLVFAACFGAMVLAGSAGKEIDNQIENGNTDLKTHVKLDSCKIDKLGFVEITYTVINDTEDNQDYWVQFAVNDTSGKRLHEAHGVVNNLGPGKTASQQKTTAGEVKGRFVCVVERVN